MAFRHTLFPACSSDAFGRRIRLLSAGEHRARKKAMVLYAKYEYKSAEETLSKIAAEVGKSIKDAKEMIRSGVGSTHYADFYHHYADKDGESTAEDMTDDDISDPERLFFQQWQADALFDAYENSDCRERTIVAGRLPCCESGKRRRKETSWPKVGCLS